MASVTTGCNRVNLRPGATADRTDAPRVSSVCVGFLLSGDPASAAGQLAVYLRIYLRTSLLPDLETAAHPLTAMLPAPPKSTLVSAHGASLVAAVFALSYLIGWALGQRSKRRRQRGLQPSAGRAPGAMSRRRRAPRATSRYAYGAVQGGEENGLEEYEAFRTAE